MIYSGVMSKLSSKALPMIFIGYDHHVWLFHT